MQNKYYRSLSLFALFGIAHWFWGNLYEAIVLAPNFISDSVHKMQIWRAFFSATNQIYYYVPLTQLSVLVICFLFIKAPLENMKLRDTLKSATVFGCIAVVLTIYIVTQINLKLFFGDIGPYISEIHQMAIMWNILNGARIVLVGLTLHYTFKACTLIVPAN